MSVSEPTQAASDACPEDQGRVPGAECDCPFCPDATHGGERGTPRDRLSHVTETHHADLTALVACPAGPHWCQNPENPAGYSLHVPAGAFRHDPYAALRSHVHCWHGNQSHPDPSCCLCDSNGCRKANDRQPTEETPMTVTDEKTEGLLPKYRVERSSDPTGKHTDCRYFVLDPQHDPLAWRALAYYAALARTKGYEALAADLQGWLDDLYDPDFVYGADQNPSFDPPPTAYPAGLRHKRDEQHG